MIFAILHLSTIITVQAQTLIAHYDMATLNGYTPSQQVSSWADSSGANRAPLQGLGTAQYFPFFMGGMNGKDAVYLPGTSGQDILKSSGTSSYTFRTFVFVYAADSCACTNSCGAQFHTLIDMRPITPDFFIQGTDSTAGSASYIAASKWLNGEAYTNNGNQCSDLFTGQPQILMVQMASDTVVQDITLYGTFDNNANVRGYIGEFRVYDAVFSDSDRKALLCDDLGVKWAINMNACTTTTTTTITTTTTTTTQLAGSVGNDPVVWFGKESKEFCLPIGQLTPIIHTRHLNMYASTFPGSPHEQWIDRIVVTNSDGFRFADVRIKKDIKSFNRSNLPQNGLESIELKAGMVQSPLKAMPEVSPSDNKWAFKRMDLWMVVEPLNKVFSSLPWHVDQTSIGKARREAVIITSPDARFLIVSSPATEYFGDFSYLSVEYAHLDVHILDMKHRQSVRGILPELWGIQKMSNRTKELACRPWSEDENKTDHHAVDVDFGVPRFFVPLHV